MNISEVPMRASTRYERTIEVLRLVGIPAQPEQRVEGLSLMSCPVACGSG